jgi:electron transfer flavoprotein beta subunit
MAQAGLNEPRYPSLKGIMAAKKKPVETVSASAESDGRVSWGEPFVPQRDTTGVLVQDQSPAEAAKQLVSWLRERKLV